MNRIRACMMAVAWTVGVWAEPQPIPSFEPNVVDQTSTLNESERASVNRMIQELRAKADMWAAVFIVSSLGEESIESLAERAFRTWKLGERDQDNGLLLVLAMEDRKMRIETGYGLEGDVPDVVAREALDDHLRPFLREGRVHDGLLNALSFLGTQRNPGFTSESAIASVPETSDGASRLHVRAGLIAWAIFIVWVLSGAVRGWNDPKRRNLGLRAFFILNPGVFVFFLVGLLFGNAPRIVAYFSARPSQAQAVGGVAVISFVLPRLIAAWFTWKRDRLKSQAPDLQADLLPMKVDWKSSIVTVIFFSGVSAIPIYALDVSKAVALFGAGVLSAMIAALSLWIARKYDSPQAYRDHQKREREREERRRKMLVEKGLARINSKGELEYTAKYYASSSSSSRSSGSSGSSSSGGGSSGGGGASSSW